VTEQATGHRSRNRAEHRDEDEHLDARTATGVDRRDAERDGQHVEEADHHSFDRARHPLDNSSRLARYSWRFRE